MSSRFNSLPRNFKLFLVGHGIHVFGNSVHALLFNLFLREAGLKEGAMGALAATTSMGIALMAFPAAFFLERFPVKPLLLIGVLLSALFYSLQIQAASFEMYTSLGLLGAMGLAVFNISVAPFVFRHTPPDLRVRAFTLNSATAMAAQLLGYTFGGKLPELFLAQGWVGGQLEAYRLAMAVALGCNLFALLPLLGILRAPVPRARRPFFGELREKDWRTLAKLLAPKALIALGAGMIIPFMNIYLSQRFKLGSAAVGACFGVMQLFTFAGVIAGPYLVRRMDRLRFILTTALLSVPFMLAMALSSSVVVVLGSFFMRNALMNMSAPVTSLFEMERVREHDCLFASAMLIFCYNTAWTFSTQVGGWVIENYGFRASFMMAAVFYVASVGCYWRFFRGGSVRETEIREAKQVA